MAYQINGKLIVIIFALLQLNNQMEWKIIKNINDLFDPPYLDYQSWVKLKLRPEYDVCNGKHGSYYPDDDEFPWVCHSRHVGTDWTKQKYQHKLGFHKLLEEYRLLNCKYQFDIYEDRRKNLYIPTEEVKERYAHLKHIFQVHKQQQYHISCSVLAFQACKKTKYYKKQEDPQVIREVQKKKRIKKMEEDSSFMDQKVGFGIHKDKTWAYCQKRYPKHVDWCIEKLHFQHPARQIAQVIKRKRNNK